MRYDIQKMQKGGGLATFTPVLYEQPGASSSSTSTKTGTESKHSISSILDDDTFKELVTKGGLINDVNDLVKELVKVESSEENENPYAFNKSNNRLLALQMIGKINELRQTKEGFDKAVMTSKQSGGWSEVAVGDYGEVYTKSKEGKIQALSTEDYIKHKDSVKLLTTSELMAERQYNPQMVGQNAIIDVANNSIGINKITDHIKALVGALGTETTSESKFYSKEQLSEKLGRFSGKKPTDEETKAMQSLQEIVNTPGEYYKIASENSSKRNHADVALDYIWKTLGQNAQLKLKATAAINGESDPRKFIMDMLITNTSVKSSTEVSPEKLPGAAESEKSLTQFQMFHNDKLASPNTKFAFNDPEMGVMFRGAIGGVAPLMDKKNKTIGMETLGNVLYKHEYNAIVQPNNVYFGDKKVDSGDFGNLIYDGNDAIKVYMPVDNGGQPDFKGFEKFKEDYAVFEANKTSKPKEWLKDLFKHDGFNVDLDEKYENGEKLTVIKSNSYVKPFLVMYGYTNDATDLIGDKKWLHKLSSQEKNNIKPELQSIWTVKSGKGTKNLTPSSFFGEDYYKGMITIPYRDNSAAIVDAMVGDGPKDRIPLLSDVQRNINYSSNQPLNMDSSATHLTNN